MPITAWAAFIVIKAKFMMRPSGSKRYSKRKEIFKFNNIYRLFKLMPSRPMHGR